MKQNEILERTVDSFLDGLTICQVPHIMSVNNLDENFQFLIYVYWISWQSGL